MSDRSCEIVVVGGGAAGIARARHLQENAIDVLLVEARRRLGGRGWTADVLGFPLDLGCGWLHSAERNDWLRIAEIQGCTIDKTPSPWTRPAVGFPAPEQEEYRRAMNGFYRRLAGFAQDKPDVPAAELLEPNNPWNDLMNAVSTYISGAELDRLSARDLARYAGGDIDWRVVEGYGRVIAAHAGDLPVRLGCSVSTIDHSGRTLKVETSDGKLEAECAIITVPTNLIADEKLKFVPPLPAKMEAAAALPLGLADKLYLQLSEADDFERDSRAYGRTDRSDTAAYHFRPLGRPLIEAYFGGTLARQLEREGESAFHDFALAELTHLFGRKLASRVKPLGIHLWGRDPRANGSYSYALPGKADARAKLGSAVDDRLFFAGEACSQNDFSTAHGAYLTGIEAAELAITALATRAKSTC
jgi:monoamine oxidase